MSALAIADMGLNVEIPKGAVGDCAPAVCTPPALEAHTPESPMQVPVYGRGRRRGCIGLVLPSARGSARWNPPPLAWPGW